MGEKLRQSDISDAELFGLIIKSAKDLKEVFHDVNTEVNKTAAALDKMSKEANTGTQKGINSITTAQKKMNTEFKKAQVIEKQTIKNSKALQKERLDELRLQKAREVAVDRFNKKQEIAIRQQKREAQAIKDSKNAYKILTKQVNLAQAEFKKLAVQHGINSKQARTAKREFDRLDKELRQVNNAARDGRRDVGRYGLALNGVRGSAMRMLGALGLLGGGLAIFRNVFNTVKDFEQGQADLASVLGTNVDGMKALTDQAKELGATTTFTATEVSTLQKEFAKLGFTQKEIEGVTEATLLLAEATGTELGEAATVTGSTLRAFGLTSKDTQRVVDVMAASFSKSSLDMQKFKVAMATVAPVAKAMGLTIEETTALIGTMTDSGVEASTAGAGLRNMMLDAKKAGLTLDEALEKIANSSDKVGTSFELFGKRGATLGVILAENQEATDKLTDSLEDADGAAKKMAETQRKTLGGALKLLSSAWDGYILNVNESTGASSTLKDMVVFLSENLETIVDVLVKVVKFYALYRIALKALKLSNHVKEIVAQRKALKSANIEQGKMSAGAVKLKGALKAIGWAAAITLAIELGNAVIEAANGTKLFREELEKFNKFQKGFDRTLSDGIKTQKELLKVQLDLIDADLADGTIKEAEALERKAKATRALSDDISGQIRELKRLDDMLVAGLRSYEDQEKAQGELTVRQKAGKKEQQRLITANRNQITTLKEVRTELNGTATGYTKITNATNAGNTATEKQISLLREIEDEQIKQIKNAQDLATIQAGTDARREIEDIDVNASAQQRADLTIEIEKNLLLELTRIDKEFFDEAAEIAKQAEEEARQAREAAAAKRIEDFKKSQADLLKAKKLELLKSNKEQEDINKEFLEFEIELLQLRTQLTLDEQISLEEKKRQLKKLELAEEKAHQDELLALRKKVFDKLDEFAQKALDKQIENSQKKQELLDKEISNSQKLEDRLRESAANQNAVATESLAAQSDITEEKERQKIAEAKKEALILEKKALWELFTEFVSQGDGIVQATGKSVGGVTGFKSIVQGLTGFVKGTTGKLGDEHTAQMSGVDGHIIRANSDEMIFSGDKVRAAATAGLHTTDSILDRALMNQQLVGVPMANHIDDRVIMTSNNSAMESTLAEILDATRKNRPIMESPILRQGKIDGIVYAQENDGKLSRKWMYRR